MLITLNNLSLTSANIIAETIYVDNSPTPSNNIQTLYRRDQSKMVSRQFTEKTISINGRIISDSPTDLMSLIDSLKQASADLDMILDVTYDSGELRRYTVNLVDLNIPRKAYNITHIPFSLELVASNPAAITPTYDDIAFSITSSTVWDEGVHFEGNFYPEPIMTITFDNGTTSTAIFNSYLGQTITIGAVVTNDVLIIDFGKKSVTLNSIEIDYTGVFPKFNYGDNDLTFTFASATACDVDITYQPRWL